MRAIFVFGGIGAGKTTVARELATALDAAFVREPVDENPFLSQYAVDRPRWAFTCQTYYYLQYVREYERTLREKPRQLALLDDYSVEQTVVIDAGAPTNKHVYARYMREHALVTPDEYALYETLTAMMDAQYTYPQPWKMIYVCASHEIAMQRLRARGREFELAGHSKAYVKAISDLTDHMVRSYERLGVPLVYYNSLEWDVRTSQGMAHVLDALRSI